MGLGNISIWQLLIVLVIVVLIFGTKRLRGLGNDLGGALKSFRGAMREADDEPPASIADDTDKSAESVQPARDRADSS